MVERVHDKQVPHTVDRHPPRPVEPGINGRPTVTRKALHAVDRYRGDDPAWGNSTDAMVAGGLEGITHQMLRRSFSTMALDSGASPKDVQGQMRHTEARMSLYCGKVIPASVKHEVNKLVDQMKTKIEEQGKKSEQEEAKAGRKR